jgi:hypothetical protein
MPGDAENSMVSAVRVIGRPFARGTSGNPGGRPRAVVNVQELARTYTEEAIRTLVEALDDPKLKVQAACALLDRGWGKPLQPLRDESGNTPVVQHLLAAQVISRELVLELASQPSQVVDLALIPPTE